MPEFQYVALDGAGSEVRGTLDAEDPNAAAGMLRQQRLLVMDLKTGNGAAPAGGHADVALRRGLKSFLPIRARDRVFFLRQTALMLRNGLTILQALEVSQEQTLKRQFVNVIQDMTDWIQAGHSLSEALKRHRRVFSDVTISLIESAEASGELDEAMERAAMHLERRKSVQRQLITSLTYPSIVVLTSIAVAVFLVWKVIPKFAAFLLRRGGQLPWSTQMLMDISGYVTQYGPLIVGTVAVMAVTTTVMYLTSAGRRLADSLVLRIPVVGNLLTVAAMSQFSHTMAMLLTSGVTLLDSLKITSRVVGNRAFSGCFDRAADQILEGRDLARSVRHRIVPHVVPHVVAVGEQTGALSDVLWDLGKFYEQELEASIKRMTALVEPVMILIIGGMVGFVYFAFFQAVFQLASGGR